MFSNTTPSSMGKFEPVFERRYSLQHRKSTSNNKTINLNTNKHDEHMNEKAEVQGRGFSRLFSSFRSKSKDRFEVHKKFEPSKT